MKRNRCGFTLVEDLVVFLIVVLFVAIVTPGFIEAKRKTDLIRAGMIASNAVNGITVTSSNSTRIWDNDGSGSGLDADSFPVPRDSFYPFTSFSNQVVDEISATDLKAWLYQSRARGDRWLSISMEGHRVLILYERP